MSNKKNKGIEASLRDQFQFPEATDSFKQIENSINMSQLDETGVLASEALGDVQQANPDLFSAVIDTSTLNSIQENSLDLFSDSAKEAAKAMSFDSSDIIKSAMSSSAWEVMEAATKSINEFQTLHPSIMDSSESLQRMGLLTEQMRNLETSPAFQVGRIDPPIFTQLSDNSHAIPDKLEETTGKIIEKLEQQLIEKDSQHQQMTTFFGNFVEEISIMNGGLREGAATADTHAKRALQGLVASVVITAMIAIASIAQNHFGNISSNETTLRLLETEKKNSNALSELSTAIKDLNSSLKFARPMDAQTTPTPDKTIPTPSNSSSSSQNSIEKP